MHMLISVPPAIAYKPRITISEIRYDLAEPGEHAGVEFLNYPAQL
jgi:hypothetical protein